jgi:hypothetical protein
MSGPPPGGQGAKPTSPKPFSKEWTATPVEERAALYRQARLAPPTWMPGERVVTAILVALLVVAATIAGGATGIPRSVAVIPAPTGDQAAVVGSGQTPAADPSASTTAAVVLPPGAQPTRTPTLIPAPTQPAGDPTAAPGLQITVASTPPPSSQDPRALLPQYRVLSYYGHPAASTMGILGEFDKAGLLREILKEKEAWEAADPSRPVMPAFEIIGSVAQRSEGENGTYLLHTDAQTIQDYIDFTQEHGIQLIIDLQIGRSTVQDEIEWVKQFLDEPNVHVALDPEFAVQQDEIPGENYGGIDATDVQYAQQAIAEFTMANNLPPKMLIVHRFTFKMIESIESLGPVNGVQTVIDFDGWGVPDAKIEGYEVFVRDSPVEFAAIKLFYKQDTPLMQPEDVVALEPAPDLVIYQ